jgi:pimeloyl-ACP methyl ester carboxylesterase
MPCLLLHGANSDVLTAEIVTQMEQVSPHMQTITVADRGHTPLLDEPEVLSALDEFLARIPMAS